MSLKSFSEVGTCTVMNEIFNFIESTKDRQIELLAETVSFPSVSAWLPTHRSHILKNIAFYETRFRSLGFETEQRDIGNTIVDGKLEQLPSVLLVKHKMEDPNKKTLLVYGHLDVQPAAMSDGWESDPWVLQERNGSLYGRGSTDDKGPVLAWSNAIEAFEQTGHIVPINIRFLLESMEESGSEGLESLLITMEKVKDPFLKNIDFCVISDNYWLGDKKPCLAYGLRGLSEFLVEIQCAKSDMHSGCCGGLVNEAMTDLVWILDKLVDSKGKIMIPKIYEEVMAISPAEEATYEKIEFDIAKRSEEIGNEFIHKENPVRVLQSLWRHPWLSIHGIEGSFADKGFKTVIPAKVIGKFSIRTVPNMSIKNTEKVVLDYLHTLWAERKSTNRAKFICSRSGEWYYVDPTTSLNFKAARRAIEKVYGESPDLIREGGSIPITIIISKCTGKDVCLLPIGCSNDGAHSQNEKIDVCNYITGCKVMAAYLIELATV